MNEQHDSNQNQLDRIESKVDKMDERVSAINLKVAVMEARMEVPLKLFWGMVAMCLTTIVAAVISTVLITKAH